ncbi:conjugal transfer protein TraD, partial [Yersinia enterocolitica]
MVKLTMKYEPMPKVADGVVLRDVQTTLDRTIEDELFKRHAEERRELNVLFTPPSSVVEMSEPVAESPSATVNSTTADTTAKQSGANDADVAVSTGSGGVEQEIGQEAVSETPPGISNEGEV